jgi:hypothetical protein
MDASPSVRNRSHRFLVLLGVVGVVTVILVGANAWRDRGWEELTEEGYEAARQRWQANALPDYDVEVEVRGRQPARYRVEVRGGLARQAWRNGAPLRSVRTFETWSVGGMFETVGSDLENLLRVARGDATATTPRLSALVQFDEVYGYPRRYLRVERGGRGGNPEVHWEVVEFVPRQPISPEP